MVSNARTIARNGKYAVTAQDRKELGTLLAPSEKRKRPTNLELCNGLFYIGAPQGFSIGRWNSR